MLCDVVTVAIKGHFQECSCPLKLPMFIFLETYFWLNISKSQSEMYEVPFDSNQVPQNYFKQDYLSF